MLDDYVAHLHAANNTSLSKRERAKAYWRAACIVRSGGGQLLGTERSLYYIRYAGTAGARLKKDFAKLVPITDEERKRLEQYALPQEGYPTRQLASEYAWQAAQLMPDDSDETAYVLCKGGGWLTDPEAADRFYKALVLRCRKTKLGQEADKLRWFPPSYAAPENLFDETP